jgi:hypothetical protein
MTRSSKPRKPRKPAERCAGKCRHMYCAGYNVGYLDGQVDAEPAWLSVSPQVRRTVNDLEGAPVVREYRARFDALLSELRAALKQTKERR